MKQAVCWILGLSLIVLAGATGVFAQTEEPVILALLPLSGNNSRHGDFARKGIELALSRAIRPVPVIFEDTQMQSRQAIDAYKRVSSKHDVLAVLSLGSGVSMALSPLANRDRTLLMAVAAAPDYSSPEDYTFRITGSAAVEAGFTAKLLSRELRVKSLAIISEDSDFGHGITEVLARSLEGQVSIVARESFLPGESDLRSVILKIKKAAPELVFIAAMGADTGLVLKQARDLGYKARFMCSQACDNPDLIKVAGAAAEGLLATVPSADVRPEIELQYRGEFGENPSFASLRMFDATRILLDLHDHCREEIDRRECAIRYMRNLHDFPGVSFPLNFDRFGDLEDVFQLRVVKDSSFIPFYQ